jgi:hypothetical protein
MAEVAETRRPNCNIASIYISLKTNNSILSAVAVPASS